MDHSRDLAIVLQDFRTQVQSLAAHLEIDSIEAESDMAGQPDVTKMAIAMLVEELSAHYKSLSENKKAEIERVIADLEIQFGHHLPIAEIIRHLREECQMR